jgi:hypothetical protein
MKLPAWVMKYVAELLASAVSDAEMKALKAKAVATLRKLAKEQTPDFPLDDVAVEQLVRFLYAGT